MSPTEIKIELLKAGVSQATIASRISASRQEVWGVIEGKRTTRRIREAVASAINRNIDDVFPDEALREPYGRIMKQARRA